MKTEPQKVNILLVDDNDSNLLALEAILEAPDRTLVRASSGTEALHFLLSDIAAVILLDIHMPGIDGLQTAELIRGRKQSRDVPIIFLTAYVSADNANLLKGYSLGAVDYITKPIDPVALQSKVAVFVDLFRKTAQVKEQADLLHEKNLQLENANFQRLGKLVELGQQLSAEREPERLLQLFCDAARDILAARYGEVHIRETGGQGTGYSLRSGAEDVGSARGAFAAASTDIRQLQFPGVVDIRSTGPDVASGGSNQSVRNSPAGSLRTPISAGDQTIGILYLADRLDGRLFTEADERLAMTLASQAAVAYENARLYADLRRHAAELEREVSERRRLEEERLRLLESERVARREAEQAHRLSQDLLQREQASLAEAEAANRFKDEFLTTISHELRTPLNAVLGWARLLSTKRLDRDTADHAVEVIERNAKAQARMVEDILDASRMITGNLSIKLMPLDLVRIVRATVDSLRLSADEKGVSIVLEVPPGSIPMLGDIDRLQQIVSNLLSNGLKFTPKGGRVNVTLQKVDSNAELIVSDTGEGIGPEFLPHVFQRFRQADSSITRAHGGLGLGLAIVRQLTEMLRGTVSAYSAGKGAGASFKVTLPLATPEAADGSDLLGAGIQSSGHENSDGPANLDLAGLRVLVVDDDVDGRDLVRTIIERHNGLVSCAGSAKEALTAVLEWNPQLLLADIAMAGEDGYALVRRVRALSADQGRKILTAAMTACASTDGELRAASSGFQAHIAKPINQAELIAVLAKLTAGAGQ